MSLLVLVGCSSGPVGGGSGGGTAGGAGGGLSVGLKNNLDQIPQLVADFDFAVNEECVKYSECARVSPFITAGKAVFHAEYQPADQLTQICAVTQPLQFSTLLKNLSLDAYRLTCP